MIFLLIIAVSILTCIGQLLQKQAVKTWEQTPHSLIEKLCSPWLIAALASLGVAMILWLVALRHVPVGTAYPMLSLNFVLVTLSARLFFREKTDTRHWIGIGAIVGGIILLGGVA